MTIRLTGIHKERLLREIEERLIRIQLEIRQKAETHRTICVQALAGTGPLNGAGQPTPMPLAKIQSYVTDCNTSFFSQLKEITDIRADPAKKQMLLDALVNKVWSEQDLIDVAADINTALVFMRDAPKNSYEEIISACDEIIATVEKPPSVIKA